MQTQINQTQEFFQVFATACEIILVGCLLFLHSCDFPEMHLNTLEFFILNFINIWQTSQKPIKNSYEEFKELCFYAFYGFHDFYEFYGNYLVEQRILILPNQFCVYFAYHNFVFYSSAIPLFP